MDFTCAIKLVDFGSLKALVSIQIEDLEIRGFKVIDQGDGNPWVSPPTREIIRDGKKDYYLIVRFPDEEARKRFDAKVLEEYRKAAGEPAPRKRKKAGEAA